MQTEHINNSMIETYVDENGVLQKIVYMATFGISPVEKRVIEKYNQLGYRVIPVDSLLPSAKKQGVLNCVTSEYRD